MYNAITTLTGQMARKTPTAFRLDAALIEGLQTVKDRDWIVMAEQVRRAIVAWLDARGVPIGAARKRAATRKRA